MSEERTEKPTPKKRKQNRKEGQVPRTAELGAWSGMLLLVSFLPMLLGREVEALQEVMARCLMAGEHASTEMALELLGDGLKHAMIAIVVMGSGILVVGVAGALAQGGFYFATKAVQPKLSKLNPLPGFKRIFGVQALWEGVKMLLRSTVVALLVWMAVKALIPLIGGLMPMGVVIEAFGAGAASMLRNVAVAGLALAAADYLVQRLRVGKKARMTKEEIKQEHKNTEGDPLVKSAIRSRQLAAARNRMMAAIAEAEVVLVNPTHVAVALRYEPATSRSPARSTPRPRSARRSPRSSSPRSPRSSRS